MCLRHELGGGASSGRRRRRLIGVRGAAGGRLRGARGSVGEIRKRSCVALLAGFAATSSTQTEDEHAGQRVRTTQHSIRLESAVQHGSARARRAEVERARPVRASKGRVLLLDAGCVCYVAVCTESGTADDGCDRMAPDAGS